MNTMIFAILPIFGIEMDGVDFNPKEQYEGPGITETPRIP